MKSLEFEEGGIQIDATVVAKGLGIAPTDLMELLRGGKITSLCERGIDDDAGNYRLTFFSGNRRLRLVVRERGDVVQSSVIDFGDRRLPASVRRPGA